MRALWTRSFWPVLLATALVLVAPARPGQTAEPTPTVVELFTSQGCYSCPPAEAYLGDLTSRPDVIALEFHVDYWDDLVYGSAGKWKDPFSSAENTRRQRSYNLQIRNTGGVYTPQMVIGGSMETVGSQKPKVERAIRRHAQSRQKPLAVHVQTADTNFLNVRVAGTGGGSASVWMVLFHRTIETKVRSGENKGKNLTSHHIVTKLHKIADWTGSSLAVRVMGPAEPAGMGCAILVQQAPGTPILGAAYCPTNRAS